MSQIGDDLVAHLRNRLGPRMRIQKVVRESGPEVLVTARDLQRQVQVVLKILMLNLEPAADSLPQFEREAAIAARLQHLHIAAVEVPERFEDLAYYAINLDYAGTSEALLSRQPPPTLEETLALLRGVASALDFAHASHTVHGRLAPSMIFLDAADQVVLSGFGSSVGPGAASYNISPAYLAPEQWPNLPGEDGSVDVYALGILAFELLSGRRRRLAFAPSELVTILPALNMRLEPFLMPVHTPLRKGLSLGVNKAIAKATSLQPSLRFATAGEFVSALGQSPAPKRFWLARQQEQRPVAEPSRHSNLQEESKAGEPSEPGETAIQSSPSRPNPTPTPAPTYRPRPPSTVPLAQPSSPAVREAPYQSIVPSLSPPIYKPVYRPSYHQDQIQWKPPEHKTAPSVAHKRGRGELPKMFAMTVVFLLAMAALSGPDFLQSVASRTGLPFLGAWASSRTSSSANDGAIALPADSSPHAHAKGRKGASSSRRVPKANKSSPAALSPSSPTNAVSGAAYGIVRVLLPGDSQPVLIDGLPRGNTPLLARLPVGMHSISLVGTHPVLPEQVRLTLKAGDTLLALFTPRP